MLCVCAEFSFNDKQVEIEEKIEKLVRSSQKAQADNILDLKDSFWVVSLIYLFLLTVRFPLKFSIFFSFTDAQLSALKPIIDDVEVAVLPQEV